MKHKALLESDRRILSAIELDAEKPLAAVAREIGLNAATVQRNVQRLIERKVLVGRTAQIDITRLGLREMGLAIRVVTQGQDGRDKFLASLRKHQSVSWIAEVGGDYDYMLTLVARDGQQARVFLEDIGQGVDQLVVRKAICERIRRVRYPRDVLDKNCRRQPYFTMGQSGKAEVLDEVDLNILMLLSKLEYESYRELARQTSMPIATFTRRLDSLRQRGIYHGLSWRLDLWSFGIQQFRILIALRGLSPAADVLMQEFALNQGAIKLLTTCVGAWDYEFEIDVWKGEELRLLVSELYRTFGERIDAITALPILAHRKYISFPAIED